jgi:glycosyltransferase involved in cell wall biosynthesis
LLSVIIPSYNSENTIRKCVESILNQAFSGEHEVILVDSSADRTPHIVSSMYPLVKLIHLERKTDPGTARNIGLAEARGDVIAFIDSDCVAARDWLAKIEEAHRSSYNVVGGSVQNGNDVNSLVAWAGYISEFREFIPEQHKKEVNHIPTCNISYKKGIFRRYGMFQGKYYPQEDLVFNHNLSLRGEKILFDPAIQVYHHHRTKLKDYFAHQRKIGSVTSRVLRKIELEGSFIPRHPFAALFVLPFLPIIKFMRTLSVFFRYQPGTIMRRPGALGIFGLGLICWAAGFAQGMFEKNPS